MARSRGNSASAKAMELIYLPFEYAEWRATHYANKPESASGTTVNI
jgi:hypothetical protein